MLRWFIIFEGHDVGKRVTQRRALKGSLALGRLVGKEEEKKIKWQDEVKQGRGMSVALGERRGELVGWTQAILEGGREGRREKGAE